MEKIITILSLEKKAKRIKKIQMVMNTILSNACYSEKEMNNQIMMGEKMGNLDTTERDLLKKGWAERKRLAKELIEEFNIFLGDNNNVV